MENRRQTLQSQDAWWHKLNLAQKFAASALFQYGYQLVFVRTTAEGALAVFTCEENKVATITTSGDIELSPELYVRQG